MTENFFYSNVNDVDRKNIEGNKILEETPCDVPSIENIEHADKSTKDSDKATAAERRKNKRKNRRKTNSESCETNPFREEKLETKISEQEPEDAVEASLDKNVSQKPKVVVPSPPGMSRFFLKILTIQIQSKFVNITSKPD